MYLIDTNVWLEDLLHQQRAAEADRLFKEIPSRLLFISSFALFSIGIILTSRKQQELFVTLLNDLFNRGNVKILEPSIEDLHSISLLSKKSGLDFDDSFQAFISVLRNLKLVSFDSDFVAKGFAILSRWQAIENFKNTISKL
ncbi:MAG: PIN domain-containing protein [Chitinophagales bacterium]|nr:PIN domain-containing protein [Chitinophagales bacterium]